jgi:hypothetical protein
MADGVFRECESSTHNWEVSEVKQSLKCNTCSKYKGELEEMTKELSTSKKIIQLLLEDLNTFKDPTPDARNNPHVSNKLSTSWETVNAKPSKSHKVKASIQDQLPIPVIPITNRYSALHNLKNNTEFPRHIQFQRNKKNTSTRQNKITDSPKKKEKENLIDWRQSYAWLCQQTW